MVEETREFLRLLGVDERRLRLKWISASEGAAFAGEIDAFVQALKKMGKSSLAAVKKRPFVSGSAPAPKNLIKKLLPLTEQQVESCVECSSCTGVCPVSRENPNFSPKLIIKQAAMKLEQDLLENREIWACLSCSHCSVRCPAMIDFPELNRFCRQEARKAGNLPYESHHGIMQLIAHMQTGPVRQQRTDWAREAGQIKQTGEYFYFVGCLPYFDVTFRYLGVSSLESARSVLALLNRIGVEPVISNDERCCGHDALQSGDEETFRQLARWNLDLIKASGAKTVLFSCPEGYATFKTDYPRYFGKLPFAVVHISEFLHGRLTDAHLASSPVDQGPLTYQDPCRLGRKSGIFDPPRQLLRLGGQSQLVEMERNRDNALCCGTSAWMECSRCSKSIQTERLLEARQTGAKTLITACPKCRIHLTCAKSSAALPIEVKDIYTFLAQKLGQSKK